MRPHTKRVLKELSEFFEIIVFTASHQSYANAVLDFLDPDRQLISHRLFRENCVQTADGVKIYFLKF